MGKLITYKSIIGVIAVLAVLSFSFLPQLETQRDDAAIFIKGALGTLSEKELYHFAQKSINENDYQRATERARKLMEMSKESKWTDDALWLSSEAQRLQGESKESISGFLEIIEKYPNSDNAPQAAHQIALIYFSEQEFEKSRQYCDLLLERYPNARESLIKATSKLKDETYTEKWYLEAQDLYEEGKYSEALKNYKKIADNYPNSSKMPQAVFLMGRCQESLGNEDLAVEIYRNIISGFPGKGETWRSAARYLLARIYFQRGDYRQAKEQSQIILDNPSLTPKKTLKDAGEIFDQADKKIQFEDSADRFQEAINLRDQEKYQEAILICEEIMKDYPVRKQACLVEIGKCKQDTGNLEEALSYYERAANDYPQESQAAFEAYLKIAEIYYSKKDFQKADQYCDKVLSNPDKAAEATEIKAMELREKVEAAKKYKLAKDLYHQGEYRQTMQVYEELLQEFPFMEKEYLLGMGECNQHLRYNQEALSYYQRVINEFPEETWHTFAAYYQIAELYYLNKDFQKAQEYCEKALSNQDKATEATKIKAMELKEKIQNSI